MKHPGVRLVVVTGGPGVVKAAMNSGKKAIGAGPGNPPAVVDETANLDEAADASCAAPRSTTTSSASPRRRSSRSTRSPTSSMRQLGADGCLLLDERQVRELEKVVLLEGDSPNKDLVGKNAAVIAEQIGIRGHGTICACCCARSTSSTRSSSTSC